MEVDTCLLIRTDQITYFADRLNRVRLAMMPYRAYLQTAHWHDIKKRVWTRYGGMCAYLSPWRQTVNTFIIEPTIIVVLNEDAPGLILILLLSRLSQNSSLLIQLLLLRVS